MKKYLILFFVLLLNFNIFASDDSYLYKKEDLPGTNMTLWEQQTKINRAIRYLQLASVLLKDKPEIYKEVNNIIKYLSYTNLNGDTFSQYARESTNQFIKQVKKEYFTVNTRKYNNHVIFDSSIRKNIKSTVNNKTREPVNKPSPQNNSNNNADLNQMLFNLLNKQQ
ncbi:hypothetical protein DEFDS_P025 (plasmid) [Deferribacter desulfuricans SSM1]|uniref:Uncharacterized protein n=1 Tax=Deferribacter desulfuricans (strain DSM 14783 / JCM 11476 / NBRC 101012 / SSM1) TaxID=639282 RepID=D3PEL1_DEFDS|nr:hypothetical protein [Deferribacter desulfuricans]BAI81653.1 hypothetical protein DEFDS_P025 [Deferribacter desulfuricans SSM1]